MSAAGAARGWGIAASCQRRLREPPHRRRRWLLALVVAAPHAAAARRGRIAAAPPRGGPRGGEGGGGDNGKTGGGRFGQALQRSGAEHDRLADGVMRLKGRRSGFAGTEVIDLTRHRKGAGV